MYIVRIQHAFAVHSLDSEYSGCQEFRDAPPSLGERIVNVCAVLIVCVQCAPKEGQYENAFLSTSLNIFNNKHLTNFPSRI